MGRIVDTMIFDEDIQSNKLSDHEEYLINLLKTIEDNNKGEFICVPDFVDAEEFYTWLIGEASKPGVDNE